MQRHGKLDFTAGRNFGMVDKVGLGNGDSKEKIKELTLKHEEFVRRFSLHILPRRFVRIRHYGILSSRWKRGKLQQLQDILKIIRPEKVAKMQHLKFRCCHKGNLATILIFAKRGPPKDYLLDHTFVPVN